MDAGEYLNSSRFVSLKKMKLGRGGEKRGRRGKASEVFSFNFDL